jgi:hypothetical protein
VDTAIFSKILTAGLKKLIEAEPEITKADEIVGDGDCGLALKSGAEAVLKFIDSGKVVPDAVITVAKLAEIVEEHMDGTSGAIYSYVHPPIHIPLPPCVVLTRIESFSTPLRKRSGGVGKRGQHSRHGQLPQWPLLYL